MNTFTFNGVNCSDFDAMCSNGGTYDSPQRDVEVIEVPGRNGDLTIDHSRYKNAGVTFLCYVRRNFAGQAAAIREWLCAPRGYCRLQDDAHPYEYRMARFVGPLTFQPLYTDKEAEFEATFDCMPQRWLVSGEIPIPYDESGVIINPTAFEAYPLIVATGNGTININGQIITLADTIGPVTIDCDLAAAWSARGNERPYVSMPGRVELAPGENNITLDGVTIEITPRWWTI